MRPEPLLGPGPTGPEPPPRKWSHIAAMLFMTLPLTAVSQGAVVALPNEVRRMSPAYASQISGAVGATGSLLSLLSLAVGALSDHHSFGPWWGRRRPFVALGALGVLAASACWFVGDLSSALWLVGAAYLLLFISTSLTSVIGALVPDTLPSTQHGVASGVSGVLTALGAGCCYGLMASGIALWAVFGALGVITALSAIPTVIFARFGAKRELWTDESGAKGRAAFVEGLQGFLFDPRKHPDWLMLLFVHLGFAFIEGSAQFIQFWVADTLDVSSPLQFVGMTGVATLVIAILISVPVGWLTLGALIASVPQMEEEAIMRALTELRKRALPKALRHQVVAAGGPRAIADALRKLPYSMPVFEAALSAVEAVCAPTASTAEGTQQQQQQQPRLPPRSSTCSTGSAGTWWWRCGLRWPPSAASPSVATTGRGALHWRTAALALADAASRPGLGFGARQRARGARAAAAVLRLFPSDRATATDALQALAALVAARDGGGHAGSDSEFSDGGLDPADAAAAGDTELAEFLCTPELCEVVVDTAAAHPANPAVTELAGGICCRLLEARARVAQQASAAGLPAPVPCLLVEQMATEQLAVQLALLGPDMVGTQARQRLAEASAPADAADPRRGRALLLVARLRSLWPGPGMPAALPQGFSAAPAPQP
eukprot:m51a1_g522 hypothetical protein (661) ;mRNA; f:339302-350248